MSHGDASRLQTMVPTCQSDILYLHTAVPFPRWQSKDVRYEHLRDALLIMHDISSTISPCHLWTNRGLSLANNHRNAIDDEHQIKALASLLAQSGVLPLIGNDTAVLILLAILILSVAEETDVDVIAI